MAKMVRGENTQVKGRVFFTQKFYNPEPKSDGSVRYGLCVAIPKTTEDVNALYASVVNTAQQQWPDRAESILTYGNPIKDGDTYVMKRGPNAGKRMCELYPEFAGMWYFDTSSKNRIGVVDGNLAPILDDQYPNGLYSGCWVNVYVNAYAYSNDNEGVAIGLNAIQKDYANGRDDSQTGGGSVDPQQVFSKLPPQAPMAQPPIAQPMAQPPIAQPMAQPPIAQPMAQPPIAQPPTVQPPMAQPLAAPVHPPFTPPPAVGGAPAVLPSDVPF